MGADVEAVIATEARTGAPSMAADGFAGQLSPLPGEGKEARERSAIGVGKFAAGSVERAPGRLRETLEDDKAANDFAGGMAWRSQERGKPGNATHRSVRVPPGGQNDSVHHETRHNVGFTSLLKWRSDA